MRSTRVPVHLSSPVLRSRPSNTSSASETAFHSVPMSSRFTEEVVGQRLRPGRKDAVPGLADVGLQDAHAADEHRHLRRGQGQQLCPIDQQRLGRQGVLGPFEVVAEAIGERLEHGERVHIGLLLRGVHASRREGNRHLVTGILRRLLDACAPGQHDQVRERDLLAAGLGAVELALDALQHLRGLSPAARAG